MPASTTRAAPTTVSIILRDELPARAARLEQLIRARVAHNPGLRGVRGRGLLLALELEKPPLGEGRLLAALLAHGISTTTKGDDAIGFSPPLTISEAEIDIALDSIGRALGSLG